MQLILVLTSQNFCCMTSRQIVEGVRRHIIGPDANRASGASSWNALRPKRYGRHAESRLNCDRYNSISDGWTSTRFGAHRVFMTVTLCYKKSIRLQQNLVFFRITNAGWARQNSRFNQSVLSRRISTMPLFEGAGGECIATRNSNPL